MHALTFYQATGLPNLVKYSWHLLDSIMAASQFVLKLSVGLLKATKSYFYIDNIYCPVRAPSGVISDNTLGVIGLSS